jgi:hypothetical protein
MKPNFALNITDTAIGLLHRTSRGWMAVGEAAFDSPDLDEAISYLRASALGLSPHGITTKLIIPPSQILYTELDAPGPDTATRRAEIRASLHGMTPYPPEDLVFDFWGSGDKVRVAIVARETLQEAEAFAIAHRLNPVSFVALPSEGQFGGEPWFGQTTFAASLLPATEKVTRDQDPVKIISREVALQAAAAPVAPPAPEIEPVLADTQTPEALQPADQDLAAAEAEAEAEAALEAEAAKEAARQLAAQKAEAEKQAQEKAEALRRAEVERAAAAKAEAAKVSAEAAEAAEAAKTETDAAKSRLAAEAKAIVMADAEAKRIAAEAEKAKIARADAERQKQAVAAKAVATATPVAAAPRPVEARQDAAAPAVSSAPDTGLRRSDTGKTPVSATAGDPPDAPLEPPRFSSRRREEGLAPTLGPAEKSTSPAVSVTTATAIAAPTLNSGKTNAPAIVLTNHATKVADAKPEGLAPKPLIDKIVATRPPAAAPIAAPKAAPVLSVTTGTPARRMADMVTAASIPGKSIGAKRDKPRAKVTALPASPPKGMATAGAQSMGKFGEKLQKNRGKPRFLGLFLVLALLLALALVAAWSSYIVSRIQTEDTPVAVAIDGAGATDSGIEEAELLADTEPEAIADADQTAQLALPDATPELVEEIVAPELVAAPEAAVPDIAQPDVIPQDPGSLRAPLPTDQQDEIFLAAVDGPPPSFDAVALPVPQTNGDTAPVAAFPPPPFGVVYEFEANGLIKPTPEGIITPEGVRLVAGRPNPLPPPRPAAISAIEAVLPVPTLAPDAAVAAATATATATAAIAAEPTSNAFSTDPSFADARPRSRPITEEPAQADDDDAALSNASATRLTSLRPRTRPASVLAAGADAARNQAQAASLVAVAVAEAQQSARVDATVLAVSLSPRPAARPRDFSRVVSAAVAEATRNPPEPEQEAEPEIRVAASAAPRIPTRASVAQQATFKNAINLSKINLIGVYGTSSNRYALVRSSSGRFSKVKVGDKVDGGTVAAITTDELRYKKGSKLLTLAMPKG